MRTGPEPFCFLLLLLPLSACFAEVNLFTNKWTWTRGWYFSPKLCALLCLLERGCQMGAVCGHLQARAHGRLTCTSATLAGTSQTRPLIFPCSSACNEPAFPQAHDSKKVAPQSWRNVPRLFWGKHPDWACASRRLGAVETWLQGETEMNRELHSFHFSLGRSC